MSNLDIFVVLALTAVYFIFAVVFMSETLAKRLKQDKKICIAVSIMLGIFSACGVTFLIEYFYFVNIDLQRVFLNISCMFVLYVTISVFMGFMKTQIDERKKYKEHVSNMWKSIDNSREAWKKELNDALKR